MEYVVELREIYKTGELSSEGRYPATRGGPFTWDLGKAKTWKTLDGARKNAAKYERLGWFVEVRTVAEIIREREERHLDIKTEAERMG